MKFTTKNYVTKHIKAVHMGLKFNCPKCNVELKTGKGLKLHLENHDRDDREILGL